MSFRHPEIVEIARREGKVTVEDLAQRFGVTLQTIRKDLSEIADAGRLQRVHGGAVLPTGLTNIAYQERRGLQSDAKSAIARKAASLIPDGASLFLNIGTTTEAVARNLMQHDQLLVVTNNINVATILIDNPGCEVIVTGGVMRASDAGLIGPFALRSVQEFKLDFAVIGCSALDKDGDILDFDMDEVAVSQAMLTQAKQTILVADSAKFSRKAPVRIGHLSEMDTVVSNDPFPASLGAESGNWAGQLLLAEP